MEKRLVLVVDDAVELREAIADALVECGCDVLGASNAEEALALLRKGARPGLILLDLVMPKSGGWVFRHAQTHDPELWSIPVVLMTASNAGPKAAQAMGLPLLKKPLRAIELLRVVEDAFAGRTQTAPVDVLFDESVQSRS